jgi:hypothetical protein
MMNWTVLVYGGPMFAVTIWWFVSAHKWFKGPKVNVEHLMLGRGDNVVEGKTKDNDSGSDTQHPDSKAIEEMGGTQPSK